MATAPPWLVSGFRLRARFRLLHTFHFLWPARHYPHVRIRHSSFERRRDFNPPEQRAAQHTLWRGPTPLGRARPLDGFSPFRAGLDPGLGRELPEVSWISCMLFLSVRGFLDYAEPEGCSRFRRPPCFLPGWGCGSASLINPFRSSIARPTDAPIYASTKTSRSSPQDSASGWSRSSFRVGLFHPLQHDGLSQRTPSMDSSHASRLRDFQIRSRRSCSSLLLKA
jgi:hypothetical protein